MITTILLLGVLEVAGYVVYLVWSANKEPAQWFKGGYAGLEALFYILSVYIIVALIFSVYRIVVCLGALYNFGGRDVEVEPRSPSDLTFETSAEMDGVADDMRDRVMHGHSSSVNPAAAAAAGAFAGGHHQPSNASAHSAYSVAYNSNGSRHSGASTAASARDLAPENYEFELNCNRADLTTLKKYCGIPIPSQDKS